MSAINTFNTIAPVYDFLHRFVFAGAIDRSQVAFFGYVEPGSRILMLGGGTGKALHALLAASPGHKVWYVEASSAMITRTRKRIGALASDVVFIHGDEEAIPSNVVFDVAITGFFLDLFPTEKVGRLTRKIAGHLENGGLWFITDFVNEGKWWQRVLLRTMYSFFVLMCRIEARRLPEWELQLRAHGFREKISKSFFGGFIKSSLWKPAFSTDHP